MGKLFCICKAVSYGCINKSGPAYSLAALPPPPSHALSATLRCVLHPRFGGNKPGMLQEYLAANLPAKFLQSKDAKKYTLMTGLCNSAKNEPPHSTCGDHKAAQSNPFSRRYFVATFGTKRWFRSQPGFDKRPRMGTGHFVRV